MVWWQKSVVLWQLPNNHAAVEYRKQKKLSFPPPIPYSYQGFQQGSLCPFPTASKVLIKVPSAHSLQLWTLSSRFPLPIPYSYQSFHQGSLCPFPTAIKAFIKVSSAHSLLWKQMKRWKINLSRFVEESALRWRSGDGAWHHDVCVKYRLYYS